MSSYDCNYKCSCTLIAVIVSLFVGIITTFLQITGVIIVTPLFLWATFGIAVGYLAILLATTNTASEGCKNRCSSLNALLVGILGTVLFSVILLAVGIIATSIVSAILVGLLLFSFSLTLSATGCRVRCLSDCEN